MSRTYDAALNSLESGSCLSKIVTGMPLLINCRPVQTPCMPEPMIPTDLHL